MTRIEVAQIIAGIGLPYAYYTFENSIAPEYPFIVYYYNGDDDKLADNTNYLKVDQLIVELYAKDVDFDLEETVENTLNNYGIVYSKTRTYIQQELAWQTTYESEVIF